MRVEPEPEGRLMLTQYDESFAQEQTVPVSIKDAQQGTRFFQLVRTKTGFCLLAGSQLILLDEQGAELARQTVDPNADGWLSLHWTFPFRHTSCSDAERLRRRRLGAAAI